MALILTLNNRPTIHPGPLRKAALRYGWPLDFDGKANSYSCPRGKEPGVAYILMLRKHFTGLESDIESDPLVSLKWRDSILVEGATSTLSIPNLYVVKSSSVSRSRGDKANTAILVELHDKRRLFRHTSIDSQYNVRRPAPAATSGTGLYYTDSLTGGSLWTWQTMLDDVWSNLPSSVAGTAPTLPYTPDAPPENWRFIGGNPWEAVHDILERIGCTTAFNPITSAFSFVRLGQDQEDSSLVKLSAQLAKLEKYRIYDREPGEFAYTSVPRTIRVFFMRREEYHGIEKDTPDSDNWEMSPVVSKDYTANSDADAATVLNAWSDLPALHDTAGTNSNSAALQTRADEIGENIKKLIQTSGEGRSIHYRGFFFPAKVGGLNTRAIVPGTEIERITWRDYGDGRVTEVLQRTYSPPSTMVRPKLFDAWDWPLWPRLSQAVKATDGSTPSGDPISENASGFVPGKVQRWAGSWSDLEDCWLKIVDSGVTTLDAEDRCIGRLSGNGTHSGDTRPVYLVRCSAEAYSWQLSADEGDTSTVTNGDRVDVDGSGLSYTTEANSTVNLRGIVTRVDDNDPVHDLSIAVDKSVAQNVALSGSFTVGTILVRNGTRNTITFDATAGNLPPINMAETGANTGIIQVTPRNPFHTIENEDATDSEDLDYEDTLEFDSENGVSTVTRTRWTVSKAAQKVTVTLAGYPPVGTIVMSAKKPILDSTFYYMDSGNGTDADLDWALMDGVSNSVARGGSGITMGGTSGSDDNAPAFFVRAVNRYDQDGSDTGRGRANETAKDSHHVDLAEFTVADHPDHAHTIPTDTCDADTLGTDTEEYQFSSQNPCTSGVKTSSCSATLTLDHDVTVDNNETATANKLQMLPPYKTLHFYERISVGAN